MQASHIGRYTILFERMVSKGRLDSVTPFTSGTVYDDSAGPYVGLSLANLEAGIRSRIGYIEALPDGVFDELKE
jgi:hypothetical protein